MEVTEIVRQIDSEIAKLKEARDLLQGGAVKRSPGRPAKKAASVPSASVKAGKAKRKLSPEARQRIAEAQKRRWAATRKAEK